MSDTNPPRDAANWFEIATADIERATAFYEALLNITLIHWDKTEPMRIFPADQQGVGGALVQRDYQPPSAGGTVIYLNVDSGLESALARLERLGQGGVVVPMKPIPGGKGVFACIRDCEGNHVGLHQH